MLIEPTSMAITGGTPFNEILDREARWREHYAEQLSKLRSETVTYFRRGCRKPKRQTRREMFRNLYNQ